MNNLAIIPARGGSKRIPKKNIRNFLGKPIIQYPIEVARNCGLFNEVIISTDDDDIISAALSAGGKIPFRRSMKNSDDFATLSDVLLEVITKYVEKTFDFVCLILPTGVMVSSDLLIESYNLLQNNPVLSGIVPVAKFSHPIERAFAINENKELKLLHPENKNSRTQDLTPSFYDTGQFYWIKTKDFLLQKTLFMNSMGAFQISELQFQDIDTEDDWKMAEIKYSLHRTVNDEAKS
ncbi:MAG: pseudaminic acid cytidylyltransferase [Chitinophagaceae bacterium]